MRPTIAIYGIPDRHQFNFPGYTHDHSVCVMAEGQTQTYVQLERWTRKKYDNNLQNNLETMIDQGLVSAPYESDWVFVNSFVGNSFLSRNGRIRFETSPRTNLIPGLTKGYGWVQKDNWLGKEVPAYSMDHELAHVFTNLPFYGNFHENSLLVHFDGGASLSNCSVYLFRDGMLQVLDFHWRLAHLSKFFNDNALTFAMLGHAPGEHCAVPGKLMGFATMGTASSELQDWLRSHSFFKDIWEDLHPFYQTAANDFGWKGLLGDTRDPFLQNLAATFQHIFQEEWIRFLSELQKSIQADYLYMSGGCALNIVANTLIVNSGLFRDVFIPPCPGDSGLSLGAAAFMEWKKCGTVSLHSPYLNNLGIQTMPLHYDRDLVMEVAKSIADGNIVAIFQGAGEIGPRALGNRSIVARPDSKALAERVSVTCKKREWYRPIAPVMLEKNAKRLTGLTSIHHLSRYMLLDFHIPETNRPAVEGVVHANGTARIQTLFSRDENPFIWDLLSVLDETYGIPALINTSFNSQGEPIVHTAEQALASASKMGLDGALINFQFHQLTAK